jgi:rfaE bifunctional protein kinase chain/domain
LEKWNQLLPKVDGVILEDYHKGLFSQKFLKTLFQLALKNKKWTAIDPHVLTPIEAYRGATLLTPNLKEAEALSKQSIRDLPSLQKAGVKILAKTGAQFVVITRGKEGMALFSKGSQEIQLIPTYAREVYDVSGAGDTVIAVLSLALATGSTLEEAAILGNLAAGIEVGKRGTATVDPMEIEDILDSLMEFS